MQGRGNRNLDFGEIAQGKRGGHQLQHPIATRCGAERDNSKGFSFWKCEGISASWSETRGSSLAPVSDYFLYKQQSGPTWQSPLPCCGHRMEICRGPYSHLISLLLLLLHSEAACHPMGRRPCRMQAFRIWDINQKTFYLRNNQLVAGYLQGPNIKLEEKIDMVPIDPQAMFLGIRGGKLCLSCVKSGNDIRLQLEAVNITDLSKTREQDKRFSFIRSDKGHTTSFESEACRGWFLCTALEADQPVSLTNRPEDTLVVTKFYFQEDH